MADTIGAVPNDGSMFGLMSNVMSGGFDFQLAKNPVEGFSTSLLMILATELGDETFIIAAVMAMRHPKLTVLGGALAALYFMTVLSAFLGLFLPNFISEAKVRAAATVLYVFFGLRLMYIGLRGEEENKEEEFKEIENNLAKEDVESATKTQKTLVRKMFSRLCTPVFLEALMLTFCAEWGDRSQIATITLASHENPLGVIMGAIVGHTVCTSLAVFSGEWLGKRLSPRCVAFTGGLLFMVFALLNHVNLEKPW
mmetsp:Transcript_105325/g.298119  ORF Transcript_105325/g.298119 Transcript_105325/m.298119 type:complete len:254 (-) Transcript_105325:253-1014(-)